MKNAITALLLVGILGFTTGTAQAQSAIEKKLVSDKKAKS